MVQSAPMMLLAIVAGQLSSAAPMIRILDQPVETVFEAGAERELAFGRWYLARNNATAAINRFKIVIVQHRNSAQVEEALALLTQAYLALEFPREAQGAAAVLGRIFPGRRWYGEALGLLQQRGLEPRDDPRSWMSRTFM